MNARRGALALIAGLMLAAAHDGQAHEGPAFAVVERRAVGPYVLSVWIDPDIGEGAIYVVAGPKAAPDSVTTEVSVSVKPAASAQPPRTYPGRSAPVGGVDGDRFIVSVPFESPGTWDVLIRLAGPRGVAEYSFAVEISPEGPQLSDIPLFVLPFAALAFALIAGYWRSRRRRHGQPPGQTSP